MGRSTLIDSPANVFHAIPFKFGGVVKYTHIFWNFENLMWIFSILVFFMITTVSTQNGKLWIFTVQNILKIDCLHVFVTNENKESQIKVKQTVSSRFYLSKYVHNRSSVDTNLILKKTKIGKIHIRFSKSRFPWVCLGSPSNLNSIGWETFTGERIKVDLPIFRPNLEIFSILEILILTWERRNQYTDDSELNNASNESTALLAAQSVSKVFFFRLKSGPKS